MLYSEEDEKQALNQRLVPKKCMEEKKSIKKHGWSLILIWVVN